MKISINFLILLLICILFSCKKNSAAIELLRQAQNIVENKPVEALAILDSIPELEIMDTDNYMQYIITSIHAKYKTKQDISGDTLIFEAQKYFDDKNDTRNAVLAHYYAGIINRKMNRYEKSLVSFLKSTVYAKKIGDNKLNGKIYEYIGAVYFEQGVMDSAVINYQKAVNYYNIEKDSVSIMRSNNQVGRCYEDLGKLDSAYIYFNTALQIAVRLNDEWYKSLTTQNLGLTIYQMGDNEEAIEHFQSALNMQATTETQKRQIYISLLKIYTTKQDINTGKKYALKVEESLPKVTFIHTTKDIYQALSNYYKLTGDYKQALQYNTLHEITIQQIKNEESLAALLNADKIFYLTQKDKKIDQLRKYNNYTRFLTELF